MCPYTAAQLEKLWPKVDSKIPSWGREEYVSLSLKLAREHNLPSFVAYFAKELSAYKKLQNEKIDLLQEALKKAEENTNQVGQQVYLNELYKVAPRLNPQPAKENLFSTARDFESNREFDSARKYYQKIIQDEDSPFDEKIKSWERYKQTFKLERKLDLYRQNIAKMNQFIKKQLKNDPQNTQLLKYLQENQISLARAEWTAQNRPKAQGMLLKLLKGQKLDVDNQAMIYLLLGQMALEQGQSKDAQVLNYLQQARQLESKDRKLKENIDWTLGLYYYLKKQWAQGPQIWQELYDQTEDESLKQRLMLWIAQAAYQNGELEKSQLLWKRLLAEDTYGYYGIISRYRLGQSFPKLSVGQVTPQSELGVFEWLYAVGEWGSAKTFLTLYLQTIKSPDQMAAYLPSMNKIGWYDGALAIYYALSPAVKNSIMAQNPQWALPTSHQTLIEELSKKYGISPYLVFAIIRQESGLNPNAKSPAHAYGLMQLTPETAQFIARKYNITYRDFNDLYKPEINLEIGIALLKELLAKFQGQLIPAIAAYNANSESVKQWVKERYQQNFLLFAEMIPYQETRKYVKMVLRNYILYQQLLGPSGFNFPEQILTP